VNLAWKVYVLYLPGLPTDEHSGSPQLVSG